jgi:excisionase family DNA binding protein
MANDEKLFVKTSTAAKMLDMSIYTVRDLVRSGALPSVRINPAGNSRLIRIPVAALRELAQQSNKRH